MDWKEILNCIFLFPMQGLMFTPAMHFLTLCLSVAGRGARGWNILVRRSGGGVRRKLGRKCHSLSRAATSYFYTNIILSQQSSASVIYTVQH